MLSASCTVPKRKALRYLLRGFSKSSLPREEILRESPPERIHNKRRSFFPTKQNLRCSTNITTRTPHRRTREWRGQLASSSHRGRRVRVCSSSCQDCHNESDKITERLSLCSHRCSKISSILLPRRCFD